MKLNQQYLRIRFIIIFTFIAVTVFIFFAFILTKDYLTPKNQLIHEKLIITEVNFNTYIEKHLIKPNHSYKCLDIHVKNKQYFIRLTQYSYLEIWNAIKENYSAGDTLDIYYFKRLLKNPILYNPNQLKVNNKIFISFNDTERGTLRVLILSSILAIIFTFLLVLALFNYRNNFFKSDKILFKKSKWKLLGKWLGC